MYDALIIGKGPAGVQAALYTIRAGLKTAILAKDFGLLEKADLIENYYGTGKIKASELLSSGVSQAIELGVSVIDCEAVSLYKEDLFKIKTTAGDFESKCVILAVGSPKKTVNIKNLSTFEGRGVSYCAVCDAFFYRKKSVCVLGDGEFALSEAYELKHVTDDVTVLTNGGDDTLFKQHGFKVITDKISELAGDEVLSEIKFENGEKIATQGLFVAYGTASAVDFAKKLGIEVNGNTIVTDLTKQTSIKGLFAAGDVCGAPYQISKAVGDGAIAGLEAVKFIKSLKKE